MRDKYLAYFEKANSKVVQPPKVMRWEYLALSRAALGVSVLAVLYMIYILTGQHFTKGIFGVIDVVESFSGTIIFIDIVGMIMTIVCLIVSTRKKMSTIALTLNIAVIITFIVFGPSISIQ